MNLHDALGRDVDELDVAPIGLKRRPNLVENCLYFFLHGESLPQVRLLQTYTQGRFVRRFLRPSLQESYHKSY